VRIVAVQSAKEVDRQSGRDEAGGLAHFAELAGIFRNPSCLNSVVCHTTRAGKIGRNHRIAAPPIEFAAPGREIEIMAGKLCWTMGFALLMLFGALGSGCSSSTPSDTQAGAGDAESVAHSDEERGGLLTASIADPGMEDDEPEEDLDDDESPSEEPQQGTPEWYVREIVRTLLKPFPTPTEAAPEAGAEDAAAADENAEEQAAKFAAYHRERNLEVIELAQQAIALSHEDPQKELAFNAAVHHLLEARLQLALAGEQADVDALYEVADALQSSRPNSEAAAEAALMIVNFAHANAVRYADSEPRWIQEFSRQAQLFAARVSDGLANRDADSADEPSHRGAQLQKDAARAAQILMAAGQSCEAADFIEDAKNCYTLISAKFPESAQAPQVAGILRRMNLKGQPLQLAGPTLDGNFVSIEDFKDKTVLVVFWASQAKPFLEELPILVELQKKYHKYVSVIGVCLDSDELQLDNFLAEQNLDWPQIFHSEPEKRGWNSPLAGYYGINRLPTIWIVDSSGIVAESEVAAADLEPKLREVVRRSLPSREVKIKPASGVSRQK
jgi:hypothetical protein